MSHDLTFRNTFLAMPIYHSLLLLFGVLANRKVKEFTHLSALLFVQSLHKVQLWFQR
jgi:hypothetical protein